VQCAIVHIGGDSLAFVTGASPVLLFLRKPVLLVLSALYSHHQCDTTYLWCSNHAFFLCASSDETTPNASKIRIGTQAFPVPTTTYDSSDRADKWSKSDMNSLASILSTKSVAISKHKISVERGSKMNARRERRHKLLSPHTGRRIREAKFWDLKTRYSARLAYTWARHTVCKIRLLF
jgi:hypothetical protein